MQVPTSAAAQLDLPDCLAVDSCMAHTERLKAGGARESKPQQSGISGTHYIHTTHYILHRAHFHC